MSGQLPALNGTGPRIVFRADRIAAACRAEANRAIAEARARLGSLVAQWEQEHADDPRCCGCSRPLLPDDDLPPRRRDMLSVREPLGLVEHLPEPARAARLLEWAAAFELRGRETVALTMRDARWFGLVTEAA